MAAVVITKNYRNCKQELGYINRYSLGQKQQTDYLQSHQRHVLNMESLPFKTIQGNSPHLFP